MAESTVWWNWHLFEQGYSMAIEPANGKATLETITEVRRWTDSLLSFRTTRPQDYPFIPGEYSRLGLEVDGQPIWRAYSLVSAPHEDFLEYYGVLVPGGLFTTRLNEAVPGSPVWIEKQRYGFMTPGRFVDGEQLWMLATGTGLGPFVSILRDPSVWSRFRHLVLVHCVRHPEEFAYRDELRALQAKPPGDVALAGQLHLVETSTRDAPQQAQQVGRLHGRITTLLQNGQLEKAAGIPITVESSRIMLCGNPQMIEETRALLHQRGLKPVRRTLPGQFVTENYW
jgi:ferredoxin--NADP+ reductase